MKEKLAWRKIQERFPKPEDYKREVGYSFGTFVIFGLTGVLIHLVKDSTLIYRNFDDYPLWWFFLSIPVALVIHDTYFYWTHRLIHHPKLFRLFHSVHHESHNPSPWAAYCVSPGEAVIQAGIIPLVALTLPIHPLAFGIFWFLQVTIAVAGHTGYEFHAKWLMDSWLGKFFSTPTNHIQHHDSFKGNFGLYFNFWDRWMGTNHPDYEKRYREVVGR